MIKQRFESDASCGSPEDFSDDLPLQLQDLLKKIIFENLLNAPKFQTDKEIRDETAKLFDRMFKPWTGVNTRRSKEMIQHKIETADACGKNKYFKWYVNHISPFLKK